MSDLNELLLERIREIKAEHPFWGYRRVWSYLRYREEIPVNKKRIYRLMSENDLLVKKNQILKACRTPMPSKPRTKRPNEIWGIDMTKIKLTGSGWLYLQVVLDWGSKKIVGYKIGPRSKTEDWLESLNNGLNAQFPDGVRNHKNLKLVSDNGCQPTSLAFMKACNTLGIKQIFTSYSNPKGNADTERVMRTIKEDLIWINEWESAIQLEKALDKWVRAYNHDYPHSTLKHLTPYQYERCYLEIAQEKHKSNNVNKNTLLIYP
jgi:transposase InsO family protein